MAVFCHHQLTPLMRISRRVWHCPEPDSAQSQDQRMGVSQEANLGHGGARLLRNEALPRRASGVLS